MARSLNHAFGLNLAQRQVDFVIPRLDADTPLCIDPFLLYKSRQPELAEAHDQLLDVFRHVFAAFDAGDRKRAKVLVDFPEAGEIRFGYATSGHSGRGMGESLGRLVLETLEASPALVRRGLRHVEELQLFSVGIGPDRISDLAANVLKDFLIGYTKRQASLWSIPLAKGVPISHVWARGDGRWEDRYEDVPIDPVTDLPILLVPRWIVRRLPWINYDDYASTTLRAYLGARKPTTSRTGKPAGVEISRHDVALVDRYVTMKERTSAGAQPTRAMVPPSDTEPPLAAFLADLETVPSGAAGATAFQRVVLRAISELFEPDLVDGREQVRTESGTEIRDVVFSNDSDAPFLRYLANSHGNHVIVFECKNKARVDVDDINQLANYLGDPMGYVGVVVARGPATDSVRRKCIATYAKSRPGRVILVLSDTDLREMQGAKERGGRPVDHLRRKYREFMEAVD
jgi:hypothetical protein